MQETTLNLFKGQRDKSPTVTTLDHVVELIRTNKELHELTDIYRRTKMKEIKERCVLFSVPCLFEGGKAESNITALTGLTLVDIDHVDKSRLDEVRRRIRSDPHTLLTYTTISGEGIRILVRYELDASFDLKQQKQYYEKVFKVCNNHYDDLTATVHDPLCKNVTRLSGTAYDPDAYYNPEAEPFTAKYIEQRWQPIQAKEKALKRQRKEESRLEKLFTKIIEEELKQDGAIYAPGHHNDYISRLGYKLNAFGIDEEVAVKWCREHYKDYDETERVIRTCYRTKATEFGSRLSRGTGNGGNPRREATHFATVDEIKTFLKQKAEFRFNEVTSQVEVKSSGEDNFVPITDRIVNSLWAELSQTKLTRLSDIHNIIDSDFVPKYNPFHDYLNSLDKWKEGDTDYLSALAATVRVKGGEEVQERFCRYLRKWFVGMVASWMSDDVVNNVILVLIGPQGSYKTTWFNYLLPPPLRQYFYTKTNSQRMTKDDLLTLAQYGLVCCEELDTMRPSELNQLKAAVTMNTIDERAAYAHYREHRQHIASFCGTGNSSQFLSDPTGNRRWLPFEVEEIVSPREHPFEYAGIYSQAYALYKAVRSKATDWTWWFNREEVQEQSVHNQDFEVPRLEHELIHLYFRKPIGDETGIFMPTSRILQQISDGISQKLSAVNVGRAMMDMNFRFKRTGPARGFIVVQRSAEEIRNFQKTIAITDPENDG